MRSDRVYAVTISASAVVELAVPADASPLTLAAAAAALFSASKSL